MLEGNRRLAAIRQFREPDLAARVSERKRIRIRLPNVTAEVGGAAWSFGFPRPDGTGFIRKLSEIRAVLKDGSVKADPASPTAPKDDQVDVFASRGQRDGLPGFLLIAAQVAAGRNWKDKSIKSHIDRVFPARWFERPPATEMVAYHLPCGREKIHEGARGGIRVLIYARVDDGSFGARHPETCEMTADRQAATRVRSGKHYELKSRIYGKVLGSIPLKGRGLRTFSI